EMDVPDNEPVTWGVGAPMSVVGKPHPRKDGADKVTGRAKYTYDVNLPGLLHGRVLRSPHAHARVASVDLSAAKAMPGVKAVLDLGNREPRFQGDEVAAVAATTGALAEDALEAIKVEYEVLPHVADVEEARKPDAPKVHGDQPNETAPRKQDRGNVENGLSEA